MSTGLVIDEDREFRRGVASWLRERDWTVLKRRTARRAWRFRGNMLPNWWCAICCSPGASGFQFCRELRQAEDPAHRCVIVATGNGGAPDRFESLEAGADEYLARPLDLEMFSAMLARLSGAPPAAAGEAPAPGGAWLKFWGVRGSIPTPGTETALLRGEHVVRGGAGGGRDNNT